MMRSTPFCDDLIFLYDIIKFCVIWISVLTGSISYARIHVQILILKHFLLIILVLLAMELGLLLL